IPVKFPESEQESDSPKEHLADADNSADEDVSEELLDQEMSSTDDQAPDGVLLPSSSGEAGGPAVAELVATRAELKRVEAEVTEPTDDYEPDTVTQEIVRGYRLGEKLIRPALVKVAVKK